MYICMYVCVRESGCAYTCLWCEWVCLHMFMARVGVGVWMWLCVCGIGGWVSGCAVTVVLCGCVWVRSIACLLNVPLISSPLATQSCPEALSVHERVMDCVHLALSHAESLWCV